MKHETDPVSADEMLVRLVWGSFYKPAEAPCVRPMAFAPRPNETDGISVFRLSCLTSAEQALDVIATEKQPGYGITLIPVAELLRIGMSVIPTPIPAVPGHAVIPELNSDRLKAERKTCQDLQMAIAVLASADVLRPPKV